MIPKQLLPGIVLLSMLHVAIGQNSQNNSTASYTLSLPQAVEFAMQNQPKLQNAQYDEQIAANKVQEVFGMGLPQITGNFDVKDFLQIPTSLIPAEIFGGDPGTFAAVKFGTKYNSTVGADATQLLFSGDYFLGLKASKVYLELTRKAAQRSRIEVNVAVSKAYFTALLNEERIKLVNANLDRIKSLLSDTKALNANGFVEKIDLDRITVTYNNLVVEKEKIQRLLELSYSLLKYQMGMDQTAAVTLTDKLTDANFQPQVSADKTDYSKRVEFSLFQTQQQVARLLLKRDKFGYLPTAMLYASISTTAQRTEFDFTDTKKPWFATAVIGGRITIPIFDGLQKHYKIQQSHLSLLKADNDLKFMQQSIDLEVSSARAILTNSSSSLKTQKENITLAEEVYRVSKLKYDQGVGSNIEVLTAETALKEAQTNYYNALFDAYVAKLDYDRATGVIK